MFCKNCGNDLKDGAAFCPKCGTPVNAGDTTGKEKSVTGGTTEGNNRNSGSAPFITSIADMEFGAAPRKSGNTSAAGGEKNGKSSGNAAIRQAAGFLTGKLGTIADHATAVLGKLQGFSVGGKKIVLSQNLLILAAAVVLVLVIGIANGARISNFFHRTFSSPEKYYQYVEKKAVKELSGNLAEWYVEGLDMLNFYDRRVEGKLTVELGKEGEEFLGLLGLVGLDMSWLKSAGISGGMSVKNGRVSMDMAAVLNKNNILSGNMLVDMDSESVYVQIPEINKKYLGFDLEEMGQQVDPEEWADMQSINRQLMEAMPNKAKFQKLLTRYFNLALGCVEDVKKSSTTLKVEGIQVKCTELKVTIDADTMQDMMRVVLEKMLADKDIKTILTEVVRAGEGINGDMDPMDAYEEFQESVEEMLEDLDRYGVDMDKIVMKVYVNGKGEIIGRKLDVEGTSISILMPQKGSKFGYELSCKPRYGGDIKLSGSGRRSGDTISGDFQLRYNGASLLDVSVKKLNLKKLKQGRPDGRLEIQLASKIGELGRYIPGLSVLEDMALTADMKSSKGSYQCTLGITYDEEKVGSIGASIQTGKGSKASVPKGKSVVLVEDTDDFLEWTEGIDLRGMTKALEKADAPDEIVEALEEADELLEDLEDLDDLDSIGIPSLWGIWSLFGMHETYMDINILDMDAAAPAEAW